MIVWTEHLFKILIIYVGGITERKVIIANRKFLRNFIKIKLTIIFKRNILNITMENRSGILNEVAVFSLFLCYF